MKKETVQLSRRYRIDHGRDFRLKQFDPDDTGPFRDRPAAERLLAKGVERLAALQDKLYAQDRWGVLLIFQAMDAAGKDGAIKHVFSGLNPQGCEVYPFKTPSALELDHDYMWRCMRVAPERGRIGIFNRSYYEETLVVRVHPEFLAGQKLPPRCVTKRIWDERFEDIAAYERYLARNGFLIRKFFLHVSPAEQKRRFLRRIDDPDRNWKFSAADVAERERFGDYMRAYEDTIRRTAAPHAPWYVIPADHKWYARLMVAAAIVDALESLELAYPEVSPAKRAELAAAHKALR